MAESSPGAPMRLQEHHGCMAEPHRGSSSARGMPAALDAAMGAAVLATTAAVSVTRVFARAVGPVGRLVMHPPLLHERLHPARVVDAFADRGQRARILANADINRLIAATVPPVVNEVLDSLDLTELVRQRVNIDSLISTVDIVAVVDRMDIDAITQQLDIEGMLRQVDLDAIVSKVDIDAIVRQVDIDAIARQVDVDAILRRLDLVAIAEEVVNGIDLPEIIRESTGSMASDVVRDARMQTIEADVAIARIVDRVIRRRRARHTDAPGEPESLSRAKPATSADIAQANPLPPPPAETPKERRP